jgi:hypothetical protein
VPKSIIVAYIYGRNFEEKEMGLELEGIVLDIGMNK